MKNTKSINDHKIDRNGVIKQKSSRFHELKNGSNGWNNQSFPKGWLKSGLLLETWISSNDEYDMCDGFSDHPPMFVICKKREQKNETRNGYQQYYEKVLEVYCRGTKKLSHYIVRDGRENSPLDKGLLFSDPISYEGLIDLITGDYGIDEFEKHKSKEVQ